jgi:uncharacterized CHY-type Zn-finger protein
MTGIQVPTEKYITYDYSRFDTYENFTKHIITHYQENKFKKIIKCMENKHKIILEELKKVVICRNEIDSLRYKMMYEVIQENFQEGINLYNGLYNGLYNRIKDLDVVKFESIKLQYLISIAIKNHNEKNFYKGIKQWKAYALNTMENLEKEGGAEDIDVVMLMDPKDDKVDFMPTEKEGTYLNVCDNIKEHFNNFEDLSKILVDFNYFNVIKV